ncbi:hypothetical protein N7475_002534 [Penicillium sp. IBT 31633x]|nr:hypothetical protein N7475_002534 [Penicillium sp. IBT 31633x]
MAIALHHIQVRHQSISIDSVAQTAVAYTSGDISNPRIDIAGNELIVTILYRNIKISFGLVLIKNLHPSCV